jgi:hypothetical protein
VQHRNLERMILRNIICSSINILNLYKFYNNFVFLYNILYYLTNRHTFTTDLSSLFNFSMM